MSDLDDLTDEIELEFRRWCERYGRPISVLGDVDEGTAAKLAGRSASTLRRWFAEGGTALTPSRVYRDGRGLIRMYSIRAIARIHAQARLNAQDVTGATPPSD